MEMFIYNHKVFIDQYCLGKYTEDKKQRYGIVVSTKKAKKFAEMWKAAGATHFETSKAHYFLKYIDNRYIILDILYK